MKKKIVSLTIAMMLSTSMVQADEGQIVINTKKIVNGVKTAAFGIASAGSVTAVGALVTASRVDAGFGFEKMAYVYIGFVALAAGGASALSGVGTIAVQAIVDASKEKLTAEEQANIINRYRILKSELRVSNELSVEGTQEVSALLKDFNDQNAKNNNQKIESLKKLISTTESVINSYHGNPASMTDKQILDGVKQKLNAQTVDNNAELIKSIAALNLLQN